MATKKSRTPTPKTKSREQREGEFSERMYRKVTTRPALLSEELVAEMERSAQEPSRGVARRVAMAVLSRPGSMLKKAVKERDGAIAMAAASQAIWAYVEHLKAVQEMATAAALAIDIALCARVDLEEIQDAARREVLTDRELNLETRRGTIGLAA